MDGPVHFSTPPLPCYGLVPGNALRTRVESSDEIEAWRRSSKAKVNGVEKRFRLQTEMSSSGSFVTGSDGRSPGQGRMRVGPPQLGAGRGLFSLALHLQAQDEDEVQVPGSNGGSRTRTSASSRSPGRMSPDPVPEAEARSRLFLDQGQAQQLEEGGTSPPFPFVTPGVENKVKIEGWTTGACGWTKLSKG